MILPTAARGPEPLLGEHFHIHSEDSRGWGRGSGGQGPRRLLPRKSMVPASEAEGGGLHPRSFAGILSSSPTPSRAACQLQEVGWN